MLSTSLLDLSKLFDGVGRDMGWRRAQVMFTLLFKKALSTISTNVEENRDQNWLCVPTNFSMVVVSVAAKVYPIDTGRGMKGSVEI